MTTYHRRLIAIFFIAIFVIVSPILLLYAAGYRYNFKKKLIQRTGAINIDVEPASVGIYIDGSLEKSSSPAIITNLLPQEYVVEIKKTGYRTWRKLVDVSAAKTRFIGPIQLFKEDVFPEFVGQLPADISNVYATSTSYSIANYKLSIVSQEKTLAIQSENLLSKATSTLETLPRSEYEFIAAPNNWVTVRDINNNISYFYKFNGVDFDAQQIIPDLEDFKWNAQKTSIAYTNHLELWVLDLNSGQKWLVTRLSSGIANPVWHPSGRYLFYQNGQQVKLIELDNDTERESFSLIQLPVITDLAINEAGNILFVKAKINSQSGWYELDIQ